MSVQKKVVSKWRLQKLKLAQQRLKEDMEERKLAREERMEEKEAVPELELRKSKLMMDTMASFISLGK